MPRVDVVFYQEGDGTVPVLAWLDGLEPRAKCRVRIERLNEFGHQLRRPEADYLRDGIHEFRVGLGGRNFRMLYFFHGTTAAVVSHGIIKERRVPPKEIERAVRRRNSFSRDPERHTYRER